MELQDAINLVNDYSISEKQLPATWADLGCGSGLFTYALANLLSPGSIIYAIDQSNTKLTKHPNPGNILIKQKQLDFISDDLGLSVLDGILMANSLHFAKDKVSLIHKLGNNLKEHCGFLIVEYDTESSNAWVPFPLSFLSLKRLFVEAGYNKIRKIHERPSAIRKTTIYAAIVSR